jgi:hypothetical protein
MIKFIQNLFNSRKQQCNIPVISSSYYQMIQKREKERSIMMQKLENEKIERGIKNEAQRWLNEYNNAQTIKIGDTEFKNCIHIMRPFIYAIIIHDEETAKYKGCNIQKLVSEEYQRLRSLNCH